MNFINVWCEYDINGYLGGNNNEAVFSVAYGADVEGLLTERYAYLWEEVKDGDDDETSLLEAGLMGWDYITLEELK